MIGYVLHYDSSINEGWIRGEDGKKYKFSHNNYFGKFALKPNLKVDFEVNDNNEAVEIYAIKTDNLIETLTDKIFGDSRVGRNLNSLLNNGIHNLVGFIVTIIYTIYIYGFGLGYYDRLITLLLVILALLFYGGAPRKLLYINISLVSIFVFYSIYLDYHDLQFIKGYMNLLGVLFGQKTDFNSAPDYSFNDFIPYLIHIGFILFLFIYTFRGSYKTNLNFVKKDKTIEAM